MDRCKPGGTPPSRTLSRRLKITFETWPINASRWSLAQAIDLDLDGRTDLLGLPAAFEQARRNGTAVVGPK